MIAHEVSIESALAPEDGVMLSKFSTVSICVA
jgi:hypothetical protein